MKINVLIGSMAVSVMVAAWHSSIVAQQPPSAGAQAPAAADTPKSTWDGVYSDEQAKRGTSIYTQQCAQCHGTAMEGVDMAPALTGGAFSANWNGTSLGDLFERIRLSMPQDNPGVLSRQDNADVLAFILSANKFPAGKMELPKETELLKQIKFDANKPGQN